MMLRPSVKVKKFRKPTDKVGQNGNQALALPPCSYFPPYSFFNSARSASFEEKASLFVADKAIKQLTERKQFHGMSVLNASKHILIIILMSTVLANGYMGCTGAKPQKKAKNI